MVSILPSARTPFDVIGADVGQALQSVMPGAMQQMGQRAALQRSLESIKQIAANPKSSPLDITLAAMQAGAGIPGSERYLGALIPELVKFAEARRAQDIKLPGEQDQARSREPVEPVTPRQKAPTFLNRPESEFFPTNVGAQGEIGNVPQAATTGQVVPLLTPSEQINEAKRLAKESTAAGIALTPQQAMEQVKENENAKKLHNQNVEAERQQRVAGQETYGKRAVDYLKDAMPNATPEQQAIFQKIGEEASKRAESEADINRYLSNEAKKFKNTIVNVEKDLSAPRLQNIIGRALNGTYKDLEKSGADLRAHLKPILDLGLYDTARNILTDKGYGPEERDAIINPLSERGKIALNKVPQLKISSKTTPGAGPAFGLTREREAADLNNIKSGLQDLKQVDPNFSLVLARKAFEDKGYNWREFKDALNELEAQGMELTDDQKIQRGYLDSAPLNTLDRILHGLNLIGR